MSYGNDYGYGGGQQNPYPQGGYPQGSYRPQQGDPPYGYPPVELKHSGLGIASCVLAAVVMLGYLASFIYAGYVSIENPAILEDEESPEMIAAGAGVCVSGLLNLIGLILGIVGVVQGNRQKLFSILGLVFHAVMILGIVLLMLVGFAAEGAGL
ncbi:MAG: hypothetical protein ACREJB_02355 [Planctomycetaceae bacterium]